MQKHQLDIGTYHCHTHLECIITYYIRISIYLGLYLCVCLCLCIDLVCSLTCRRAQVLKPQKRVTACRQRVAIAARPCQRKNHKAKTTEAHKFKRVSVTNIIQHHLVIY